MFCKDCYHSNMCVAFECDEALTFCRDFKDKSQIIELPMKVTDELKEELTKYCYERCVDEL